MPGEFCYICGVAYPLPRGHPNHDRAEGPTLNPQGVPVPDRLLLGEGGAEASAVGIVTFSTTDPLPRTTEEARARLSELQTLRCPRCDRGEGVAIMAQHPLCVSRVAPSQLGPLVRVALASPPPSASRCNPAPLGVHMERSFDACFALRCPSCPAATISQVGLLYLSPRSEGLVERVGPLLRVVPPPCGARRGSAQPRPRLHGGAPRHLGYIAADTSARSRLDSAHSQAPADMRGSALYLHDSNGGPHVPPHPHTKFMAHWRSANRRRAMRLIGSLPEDGSIDKPLLVRELDSHLCD